MALPVTSKYVARISIAVLCLLCAAVAHGAIKEKDNTAFDRIVVVVNDDVITSTELARELRNVKQQLRQQNNQAPTDNELQTQVLDRMILKRLQLQTAETNHIKIDDEALNRTILNIATQNKMSLSEFRDVLEKDGYNFAEYRESIREEMTIGQLRQRQVSNRVVVTDQEVEETLDTQSVQGGVGDEYRVGHILVEIPEAANAEQIEKARQKAEKIRADLRGGADFAQTAIAKSDGQQALQGGDLGWRKPGQLPTLFANIATAMKVGDLSDVIRSPSGFHIIKLTDKRKNEERHFVTQTHGRHILIRTNELTSNDDASRRLAQLKQRIEAGDNFADLARARSEDAATSVNGGDLGWISPGDLVPAFEEEMAALKINEISKPFKTQFGWHIVQVLERREHDATDELKKTRAREQIRQRKLEEETQTWLRQLRDEAYVEMRK